jgi:hypothetical protein
VSNKLSLPFTLFWTPPKQWSCGLVRIMPLSPQVLITTSEGLELEVVTSYKYLGVWLDFTLSFSQHISKLLANVKSRLGFFYRNHSSFTPAAKLSLIQMTILPMLDYGDILFSKGALERLNVLYHSAILFATNSPYRPHHCTLYYSVYLSQDPQVDACL